MTVKHYLYIFIMLWELLLSFPKPVYFNNADSRITKMVTFLSHRPDDPAISQLFDQLEIRHWLEPLTTLN
jgi:hypothetical protein